MYYSFKAGFDNDLVLLNKTKNSKKITPNLISSRYYIFKYNTLN